MRLIPAHSHSPSTCSLLLFPSSSSFLCIYSSPPLLVVSAGFGCYYPLTPLTCPFLPLLIFFLYLYLQFLSLYDYCCWFTLCCVCFSLLVSRTCLHLSLLLFFSFCHLLIFHHPLPASPSFVFISAYLFTCSPYFSPPLFMLFPD